MPPDERAFRAHVSAERFSAGVDSSKWRLVGDVTWPYAVIAISAAPRTGAPQEFSFRFELSGYPNTPPTAAVWNTIENRLAVDAERPKVTYSPSPFRSDWLNGTALYIPCDRLALPGHSHWLVDHPDDLWDPTKGISSYLIYVRARLNEDAYVGL